MDDVELVFTARLPLLPLRSRRSSARPALVALRTILEQTLLDVMYELPSMSDVSRCCIVDADAILGDAPVTLNLKDGEIVDSADYLLRQ